MYCVHAVWILGDDSATAGGDILLRALYAPLEFPDGDAAGAFASDASEMLSCTRRWGGGCWPLICNLHSHSFSFWIYPVHLERVYYHHD